MSKYWYYAKIRITYFPSHVASQISWRQLVAKAKERGRMATLSHLLHGTLASGSAWNQRRILRTLKPLALPVPSPVCAEWLPPTQVNRYFGPKLSFAPNFHNSVYSLPNNGKLTLADGLHEGTMGHKRGPQDSSANKNTERKGKRCLSTGLFWSVLFSSQLSHILPGSSTQGPYNRGASWDLQTDGPFDTFITRSANRISACAGCQVLGPSVYTLGSEKMGNKQWFSTHCEQELSWSFSPCLAGRAGSDYAS